MPNLWSIDTRPKVGEYDPRDCIKKFLRGNRLSEGRSSTFFKTRNGRFGFSGYSIEETDEICVLPGGCNPFVLRECGENHQLVDYCFVHGMMEREMVDLYDKGLSPLKEIRLD
jgi:hypothetical protein